jgi:GrpB-like predicted nucleotidyltransferase (UPF0157 family)
MKQIWRMTHRFGADRRKVTLVPHSPAWAARAAEESGRLAAAIGETLIRVEHIGSTAIPGIAAKPIIDLMPIVQSLAALDARRPEVEALGYVWRGEFGIPGRRYCIREENGQRLFHVHCNETGNPEIARTLNFRDYLLAHPDEAGDYEAEKWRAAIAQSGDSLAYNDHKSGWIRSCIERATVWAAGR